MRKMLIGLIGAGIQRSLSPALQEEEARHHGLRLHYQLIDLEEAGVGPEVLPELIRAARVVGFAGLMGSGRTELALSMSTPSCGRASGSPATTRTARVGAGASGARCRVPISLA